MIRAPFVANASVLTSLLFSLFTALVADAEQARTAAQIDWVPSQSMTPEARARLPWYCDGEYREPPPATGTAPDLVRATADSGSYVVDKETNLVGHVHVEQGYRRIDSPHVRLDATRQVATVDGPLVIREKGLIMTGDHATSNLATGTGTVDDATFLLHEPGLRGEADRVERLQSTDLVVTNGRFTRCEPGSNAWAMRGKHIRLEPRTGFGTARSVTIEIKDVPVAYFPYIRFPIDDKRHTGFLMPGAGYDHDGGTDLIVPYYFNLAPQYDFTYEPRSLWRRGLIHSIQFRFLAGSSVNEINAGYIAKDGVYDDRNLVDQTSSGIDTSAVNVPPFEKKDRWLLNVRHTGGWSSRWKSTVDYSAVSDVDYLHDIGGDVGSASVDQYINSVDQTLTTRRSAALDRLGQVQYRGNRWNSTLIVHGFQNLDQNSPAQYELLPRLSVDYSRAAGPADVAARFEYSNFDKDTAGITGPLAILGQREVVDAAISIRKSAMWGYIEPKVDVIHRAYELSNTPAGYRTRPATTTPRLSVDAGLYFDRSLSIGSRQLQQTLEPRVFYLFAGDNFQDDLPRFDAGTLTPGFAQLFRENRFNGWDRIGDARQVSVGVTTRFLDANSGSQFLEASMGQIYYLKDRKVIFQPSPVDDPTAARSPLFWEARFSFPNGLDLSGSFEWEPSANRSNRGNFSLKYVSGERKIFNISYIYTNPEVQPTGQFRATEESDLSFIWPVGHRWSVIGRWNFGWNLDQTIESIVGLEYNDCCWKSRLVLRRFLKEPRVITVLEDDPASPTGYSAVAHTIVPHDTGIFFEFQLKGLATLGKRLDQLLSEAIPGYRAREEKIGN